MSSHEIDIEAADRALRVAVVGTGYVGLTTGVCLAHLGAQVVCCDVDAHKVAMLSAGHVPIVEEGLEEILADAVRAGNLTFVLGCDPAVRTADVVFLCVPTPQDEDGSADLSYVRAAAAEIGPILPAGAVVVNKSTVPVGSFGIVGETLGRSDVSVVSNPEFLREGTAVNDFLHPDRVVIGSDDERAARIVAALYAQIDTEFVFTDPTSAELIKYAANGFLAMKISFINSVAALCEHVGRRHRERGRRHRLRPPHRQALPPARPGLGRQLLPEGFAGAGVDGRAARLRLLADARRDRHQRAAVRADGAQGHGGGRPRRLARRCGRRRRWGSRSRPAPTTCASRRASG